MVLGNALIERTVGVAIVDGGGVSIRTQIDVRVIATRCALHFFEPSSLSIEWYKDEDEWVRGAVVSAQDCYRSKTIHNYS